MDETLACPACRGPLSESVAGFICAGCGLNYPKRDGIPVLLPPTSSLARDQQTLIQRDQQALIHDELSEVHNSRKLPIYWETGFRYVFNLLVVKHSRMIARLHPQRGERHLDVGCQDGMILSQVARRWGVRGTGVDVSVESVRLALGRNTARNRYYLADAMFLPFRSRSFDCAHSLGTMEHVPDQSRYIGELARVLRPGGRLLFDMLNSRDALTLHGIERWWAGKRGRAGEVLAENMRIGHDPAVFIDEAEARRLCASAGLAVRGVFHYNAIFPLLFDTRLPGILARLRRQQVDFHGRPLGPQRTAAASSPGATGASREPMENAAGGSADSHEPPRLFLRRAGSLALKGALPLAEALDWPLTAMGYGNSFYVLAEKTGD